MPRPSRPWFRFYVEAIWDRKLRRLTPPQRWLWVVVLAFARQSPRPGVLLVSDTEPVQPADLADASGLTARQVTAAMSRMVELGMVTVTDGLWSVTKWSERQYESDSSTQRTRKHRSKEPRRNVPTSSPGTDQRTETETEEQPLGTAPPPGGQPRPSDPLFEALAATCGWPLDELTDDARGRLNAAAKQLRHLGATPAQVTVRAGKYRRTYPNAPLTPQALTGNWAALANGQPATPPPTLGRALDATPVWDLDELGNAIPTDATR